MKPEHDEMERIQRRNATEFRQRYAQCCDNENEHSAVAVNSDNDGADSNVKALTVIALEQLWQ